MALASSGHGGFAVRSGGHSHWAGGSNIDNGVTNDLGYFNKINYDTKSKVASLGPAQRWGDVFQFLEQKGVIRLSIHTPYTIWNQFCMDYGTFFVWKLIPYIWNTENDVILSLPC